MENEKYEPYVCMMTNSTCYKNTEKMEVFGILWHDTGCNNDTLKRYVQPSDNDPRKDEILAKIGKNRNGNDWNHVYRKAGVNAFVGRFADDSVGAVQVMPWDYRPWGCGSGSLGSCNDHWIQFEICEDAKTNKEYALEAYNEACKLTAYLCDKFHLDPFGTVNFKGQKVPVILCHWDSYLLGLGSGHDDIYDWFPHIIGKGMDDVRKDVAALMQGHRNEWVQEGDKWYYYDLYGNMVKSDWVLWKSRWYYLGSDGAMLTGWQKINGKKYYLYPSDGHMASYEWIDNLWLEKNGSQIYPYKGAWKENKVGKWYEDTAGWYPRNREMKINKKKYKFDKRGYLITG